MLPNEYRSVLNHFLVIWKTRVKKVILGQARERPRTGVIIIYEPQGSYLWSFSQFSKVDEVDILALSQIEYYKNRQLYFEPDFWFRSISIGRGQMA